MAAVKPGGVEVSITIMANSLAVEVQSGRSYKFADITKFNPFRCPYRACHPVLSATHHDSKQEQTAVSKRSSHFYIKR